MRHAPLWPHTGPSRIQLDIKGFFMPSTRKPKQPPTTGRPDYFTTKAVARKYNCSESHVRDLCDRGHLPHVRDGSGRRLIRPSDADALRSAFGRV